MFVNPFWLIIMKPCKLREYLLVVHRSCRSLLWISLDFVQWLIQIRRKFGCVSFLMQELLIRGEVTLIHLIKLPAVESSCQQSAAAVSFQAQAADGAEHKRKPEQCKHACCRADSPHAALMDESEASWMGLKSHNALSLMGCCPAVPAVTVMPPSVEWGHVKQRNSPGDLEKLQREKKSRAELKENYESG